MHSTSDGVAAPLDEAAIGLLDADLSRLSDAEATALLRDVERVTRRLAAVSTRVVVEAIERGFHTTAGYRTPQKYLVDLLRLSGPEASARVTAARRLGVWHHSTGESITPDLEHTATAQRDGDISADHARRIAHIIDRIPSGVTPTETRGAEQIGAHCARTGTPEDIDKVGQRLLTYLDPDGRLTDERDRKRRRGITLGRQRADLMSPIHGEIDPLLRALLEPLLAKWAQPGMNNPDDAHSPAVGDRNDGEQLRDAARRDTRTAPAPQPRRIRRDLP